MTSKSREQHSNPEKDKEQILLESLSDFFHKEIIDKMQLPVKQAILIGSRRVDYFRGKDFIPIFKDNYDTIKTKIKQITSINIGNEYTDKSIINFFQIFFDRKLLLKIVKNEDDKSKYPKKMLIPKMNQFVFEEKQFYWINMKNEPSKKPIIYLGLLITIIVLVCMFPIWPLKAKIGFLWGIIGILVLLIIFLLICIIIPFIAVVFGYDAMLFPNLFDPDAYKKSWRDRFHPVFEAEKVENTCANIVVRICIGLVFVLITVTVFVFPQVYSKGYEYIKKGINFSYNFLFKNMVEKKTQVSIIDKHYNVINDNL